MGNDSKFPTKAKRQKSMEMENFPYETMSQKEAIPFQEERDLFV